MRLINRDKNGRIVGKSKVKFTCDICLLEFLDYESNKTNKAKLCSRKCFGIWRSKKIQGINHPKWAGNNVGYGALHNWIKKYLPVSKCEFCGSTKNLQRANKSHEYKRDLSDWIVLCSRCHFNYDEIGNKVWEKRYEKNIPIIKEIRSLYSTGNYSQHDLGLKFNYTQSGISRIVKGDIWQE